jgi:hypothetical protein
MAAGLQIWNENGQIILDATHRVMRFYGSYVLANGQNGSVTDPGLAQGCFISFQPDRYIGYGSGGTIHPQFSFDPSTGTLSWSYAAKNSTTYDEFVSGTLFYGAY